MNACTNTQALVWKGRLEGTVPQGTFGGLSEILINTFAGQGMPWRSLWSMCFVNCKVTSFLNGILMGIW